MQIIIFILSATIPIVVLIRLLHARQQRSTREVAERTTPLPPLDETPLARETVNVIPEIREKPGAHLPWQDEVRALRDKGRFQEAIQLCRRQYPKMLAFRQTLITMRARFKQEPGISEEALDNLYRTAILANLAKSGKKESDINALSEKFEHSRDCWDQLGYRNLDLLTKNDCKLLADNWGEPKHHSDITSLI